MCSLPDIKSAWRRVLNALRRAGVVLDFTPNLRVAQRGSDRRRILSLPSRSAASPRQSGASPASERLR